jgi:hypothetical protein
MIGDYIMTSPPHSRGRLALLTVLSNDQSVEAKGILMSASKLDPPQDTFDLLILKTVALGAIHGGAIVQRLEHDLV